LRSWNRGDLALEKKITADSIVYETVWHSTSQSRHHYHAITYDLEKDIQAETRYSTDDNEVIFSKNYQWITDNGVPDRFIYTNCFRGNERESMRNKTTEFKVAEDGSVINKHNGLFTDPFHMFNYYKRYEMFEGIPDPHERLLVEDHLLSEKEFAHLLKFDGTSVVYRFDISYVYR
jgi:hypothetical protein